MTYITAMIIGAVFIFILSCPVDIKKEKYPYIAPQHDHIHPEIKIESFNGRPVESNTATVVSSSTQPYHYSIIGR